MDIIFHLKLVSGLSFSLLGLLATLSELADSGELSSGPLTKASLASVLLYPSDHLLEVLHGLMIGGSGLSVSTWGWEGTWSLSWSGEDSSG